MTLEEAIKHCLEVAEIKKSESEKAELQGCDRYSMKCEKCSTEHRQLAEWLKELKKYRTLKYEVADWKASISCDNTDYYTGYMSALSVFEGMIAEVETINEEG